MNILILGARGMLGTALREEFKDLDPTCWDREELDIIDADAVQQKIAAEHPTIIINAAAYTDVDGAEKQRELAFAVNEHGVRNLATTARHIGATLVHYSTDYVFPGTLPSREASAGAARFFDSAGNFLGYPEDWPPGPPVNAYGESKLAGERVLQEIAPTFYLIRSAWLYGPNGDNFVDTMLHLAQEKDQLSVVDDQHGSPTYTKDLAFATRRLIEEQFATGVYHLVNAGSTTWYEFARKIFELAGLTVHVKPLTSQEFPRPAARPRYSMLNNMRGPALRSWEEALGEYLSLKLK